MRYIFLGKRVRCSTLLPLLAYLWCVFAGVKTAFFSLAAVAVHEAGHIIAGYLTRRKISSLTLSPLGADIVYTGTASYGSEIFAAFSGPFFSLFSGIALYGALPGFSAVSIAYGLLNLIPVPCFDGGRALRSVLYSLTELSAADKICGAVNIVFLIIMYLFSVFLLFYTSFNASLLLLCAYVFADSYLKMR